MGPQSPRGQLHPCLRTPRCTKKLADYLFPSQQSVHCQEKTKCLPQGKQSCQQEAEDHCTVQKQHAQPRQGAFAGPLTCCQGPVRTALASILTRMGVGRAVRLPLQVPTIPGMAKETFGFSLTLAGSKPHTMTWGKRGQVHSIPSNPKHILTLGGEQADW